MPRRLLLLLLTFAACTPAPPPPQVAPPPPPPPQLTATATAQRVVLVSLDGLGADMLATHNTPAFAAMSASARVIPVNPTVTSTTHVSMLTGAQPDVHGIVANRFHLPGTPPEQTAVGLQTDIAVETLVEAAQRQGKRVGSVPFPTVDGRTTRRRGDFGIAWTMPVVNGRTITLSRTDFHREWVPPTWTDRPQRRVSYSPIMRARLEWSIPERTRLDVDLVAYDTTNDAAENYDTFFVEAGEEEITPDATGWFAISTERTEGRYGSWSKLLRSDATLSNVELYWGPISRTDAWPEPFRAALDAELGFWPGPAAEVGHADADTFIQQSQRLADFLLRAQQLAIARMPFDLLLAYYPTVDAAEHNYIRDARVIGEAFAIADRALAAIRTMLDPARDALVVTGDHGVAALDREVRMNRLLAEHGFAPRWRAFASGNIAQLYRFEEPDDSDAVVTMLRGSGHFEEVRKKSAASHANSGDVVAVAWPNIALTPSSNEPAVTAPMSAGQHGGLNTHRELHTALFAAGAGVPSGDLGEIPQTRIARFVSQLLGIQPPAAAE